MTPGGEQGFWQSIKGAPLWTFLLCLAGMTLSTADQALFSFAIPGLSREFGLGMDSIGLLLSASFAVASVTVVLTGLLTDRIGRRKVFVMLLAASATCVGLHGLAGSITLIAVLRILGFAFAAGLYPVANTLVIEAAPPRYRGILAGCLQMGYPFGFFLGSLFAAPLLEYFGWRAIFLPAFVVVPLAFVIGRFLKESPHFRTTKAIALASSLGIGGNKQRIWRLFQPDLRRRTTVCFTGSFFVSLSIGSFTYFIPVFLTETKGFSDSVAAQVTGLSYLLGAGGYLCAALAGEFVSNRRNVLIAWIGLGAVFFFLTIWYAESRLMVLLGFAATVTFLFGTEAVRMPLIGELFPTELRVTATAVTGSLGVTTAWLSAPLMVGLLVPIVQWEMAFTLVAVMPLIVAAIAFMFLQSYRQGVVLEDFAAG